MEFRLSVLISTMVCAVSLTIATPTTPGECLSLLGETTTTESPTTQESVSLPDPKGKVVHHLQRRTAPDEGLNSSVTHNPTTVPGLGASDVQALVKFLTLVPVDALRLVRFIATPALNIPITLAEQFSNSSIIGDYNGEGLLAGLQGNASQWLHLNGSTFGGAGLGNLSFPQLPSFQTGLSSNSSTHPHSTLFNTTRAGDAARTAAVFGERLLLTPLSMIFTHATGQHGSGSSQSLNADHLQRHLAHLTQFWAAVRGAPTGSSDNSTVTGAPQGTN